QGSWVELDEGRADRRPDDLGIEQGRGGCLLADVCDVHGGGSREFDQNRVFARIASCSTMGPSASAGKKVRPPTMTTTPTTRPTKSPPVVGNVPAEAGTDFLAASEPAIAIAGMIIQNRPTPIAMAPVTL